MKKKKKLLWAIISVVLIVILAGCGKLDGGQSSAEDKVNRYENNTYLEETLETEMENIGSSDSFDFETDKFSEVGFFIDDVAWVRNTSGIFCLIDKNGKILFTKEKKGGDYYNGYCIYDNSIMDKSGNIIYTAKEGEKILCAGKNEFPVIRFSSSYEGEVYQLGFIDNTGAEIKPFIDISRSQYYTFLNKKRVVCVDDGCYVFYTNSMDSFHCFSNKNYNVKSFDEGGYSCLDRTTMKSKIICCNSTEGSVGILDVYSGEFEQVGSYYKDYLQEDGNIYLTYSDHYICKDGIYDISGKIVDFDFEGNDFSLTDQSGESGYYVMDVTLPSENGNFGIVFLGKDGNKYLTYYNKKGDRIVDPLSFTVNNDRSVSAYSKEYYTISYIKNNKIENTVYDNSGKEIKKFKDIYPSPLLKDDYFLGHDYDSMYYYCFIK